MKTAKYRLDRANIPFTNFNITDTPWVSYVIGSFGDPARVAEKCNWNFTFDRYYKDSKSGGIRASAELRLREEIVKKGLLERRGNWKIEAGHGKI